MATLTKTYRIGKLQRTLTITSFTYGVYAVCQDKTDGCVLSRFDVRNFRKTKNYPTIDDNIKRALRYYKAPKEDNC